MRDSDDRRERDRGVLHQQFLDLTRVDVEAAANDQILGTVDDVVVAVCVLPGEIPRTEPAITQDFAGCLGAVEVALHYVVAPDRNLADGAGPGDIAPVVI